MPLAIAFLVRGLWFLIHCRFEEMFGHLILINIYYRVKFNYLCYLLTIYVKKIITC